jgi:CubicO group peptidase (beta-lactamase class C family)
MALADEVINNAITEGDFPGAVLCIVSRATDGASMGDVLYLKAYGNRQVVSGATADGEYIADTIAMTTDAVFDLASVSKCVGTTLSVMRLAEDGKLRIDDKVERYIKDFAPWKSVSEEEEKAKSTTKKKGVTTKKKKKQSKPAEPVKPVERKDITLRHLLNHTSGLAAGINVKSFLERYEAWGDPLQQNLRDSLVVYLAREAERRTKPGEEMKYSCLNFILLQAIIENIAGERLDHFATSNIFAPLRLKNTWYNPIDEAVKPFSADAPIVPTSVLEDGTMLCGEVHDPTARVVNRGVSGNAGLFSTAEDLAVVASMLMNGGKINLPRQGWQGKVGLTDCVHLYSHQTIDTFALLSEECRKHGRALGWDTGSIGDLDDYQRVINHTGYTGTSLQINLDEGIAIILLTNRVHPTNGNISRTRALVTNIITSALKK